jgi:hypothetical protein
MGGKTPNFSLAAYKVLRTLYRSNGGEITLRPSEASQSVLIELSNLCLIQCDHENFFRAYITAYGRRVYFECDAPEGAKE